MSAHPTVQTFDEAVQADVVQAMFGRPLVTNVFRSLLVEAMIAKALGPEWKWCSADFAAWDLEHASGLRLEVKQSAALQSWSHPGSKASAPRFDIAHRTGRWDGDIWVKGRARHADIYVFAYHPLTGEEADHRRVEQWRFYVLRSAMLPDSASISLPKLSKLTPSVGVLDLTDEIERIGYPAPTR